MILHGYEMDKFNVWPCIPVPIATGLPLPPVVCLLVTMGLDMNEWLIAWIKQCAQSARLSGFNPHGNHGIAWSCSVEDYRALLWLVCIYGYSEHGATAGSARRLRA